MKTAKKLQRSTASVPCFECEGGSLLPVLLDYSTDHPKHGSLTIPAVPMLQCDACRATVIGEEGNSRIDSANASPIRRSRRSSS